MLNVGAGILAAMQKYGDHALEDSHWSHNADGTSVERCEGLLGRYTASNAGGSWEVAAEARNAVPGTVAPIAETWIPSPNFYPAPRSVSILAIVIHSMNGSLASTDSYFGKTSSQVSAHKGIGLDGTVHRYVDDENAAWGNGILSVGKPWRNLTGVNAAVNPNQYTLSIETEDNGDSNLLVGSAQFLATERVCRAWMVAHPTIKYLVAHNAITATACPGPRWLNGKLAELGQALGLQVVQ